SWYQEIQLTVIYAVIVPMVMLLQCNRSGFDTNEDKLFFNLQRELLTMSLFVLEQQAANGVFSNCVYVAMALYSLVDWTLFRELMELDDYPALLAFTNSNRQQAMINETDPRLG